jgi:hypothetical protein
MLLTVGRIRIPLKDLDMKLNLFTQNVQGLNASVAQTSLRNFLLPLYKDVEVMCL